MKKRLYKLNLNKCAETMSRVENAKQNYNTLWETKHTVFIK